MIGLIIFVLAIVGLVALAVYAVCAVLHMLERIHDRLQELIALHREWDEDDPDPGDDVDEEPTNVVELNARRIAR